MPGRNLSRTEKKLQSWWSSSKESDFPLLTGITVKAPTGGLRGIREIDVEFSYPVSVIAGANGAGKTTILTLAALGFHKVDGHSPRGARRIIKPGEKSNYYTFQDFFFKGPGDPDMTGLEITWKYRGHPHLSVSKQSDKWMRYERRQARPVHHFGISRALPAIEQSVLRSHFGNRNRSKPVQLSEQAVKWVGQILRRNYQTATSLTSDRYNLRQCNSTSGARYSSFNMGAGEDLLFDLIGSIDRSPDGSLIVIEEIEVGIHASALRRLAEVLQDIALAKKLQIIVTSHSEQFVDALPRNARILLQRIGDKHLVRTAVSTGFIFSELAGTAVTELKVYCEDSFAQRLIEAAIEPSLRSRVAVQAVGDKNTVANIAAYHVLTSKKTPCVVVWDGDVTETEAESLMLKATTAHKVPAFTHCRLPGSEPPELSVSRAVISCSDALHHFALCANVTPEKALAALEAAISTANHHSIPHELSQELGPKEDEVVTALTQAVCRSKALDLLHISTAIKALL